MLRNISLALAFVLSTSAHAAFFDIGSSQYPLAIQALESVGIIEGYSDGSFRPFALVNRAEFTKLIVYTLGPENSAEWIEGSSRYTTQEFPDVSLSMWDGKLNRILAIAKSEGYVRGNPDGTFAPERSVNFAEAAKIITLALGYESYGSTPWYEEYIDALYDFDSVPPSVRRADQSLTREEISEMLYLAIGPIPGFEAQAQSSSAPQRTGGGILDQKDPARCGDGTLDPWEQCDDGNNENDDGCSSICIVVDQPIRHGALRIDQRPLGTLTTAKGVNNIVLLTFDAVSGRQNMFINVLKFETDTGSFDSATNYRLYYDRSGDGKPNTRVDSAVPQGDFLTFANLAIPVRKGLYTAVELRADIQNSGTLNNFSIQLAISRTDYIEGTDAVDGEDVTGIKTNNGDCNQDAICWISVYTQDSRMITLGTVGSLYVSKDSNGISSHQLLLGERSDDVLRLEFFAQDEDIEVTKVGIGGGTSSIDSLELYFEGMSTPFATARQSSCTTVTAGLFCADTAFIVERDDTVDVIVRAIVNSDTNGGTSGETATFVLSTATSGNTAVEASGASSLVELVQNDSDSTAEGEVFIGRTSAGSNNAIEGPTHDLVGAKFASITNSNIDSDDSPVPSGSSTIGQFTFRASLNSNSRLGNNAINFRTLIFKVSATNITFVDNSFGIFNPSDSGTIHSCSNSGTTGNITVTCSSLTSSAIATGISEGDSLEIAVQANISDPQVANGNSVLQVQLSSLGSRSNLGTIVWDDDVFPFEWVDLGISKVVSTLYRSN